MSQVTLYLDDETEAAMQAAAKAANLSKSKWVAQAIRQSVRTQWPAEVSDLAGAWRNFPEADALRESTGEDSPREAW